MALPMQPTWFITHYCLIYQFPCQVIQSVSMSRSWCVLLRGDAGADWWTSSRRLFEELRQPRHSPDLEKIALVFVDLEIWANLFGAICASQRDRSQLFYFRSELIFWIELGCGIADFGRRGLKTPQTQDFWVFILSPGTSTRGATWDLDSRRQGPRLAAQGTSTRGANGRESRSLGAASRSPMWRRESRSLGTK